MTENVVQALRKEPMTVYGDGKQTRSFQYVSDLVRKPPVHLFDSRINTFSQSHHLHRQVCNHPVQTLKKLCFDLTFRETSHLLCVTPPVLT